MSTEVSSSGAVPVLSSEPRWPSVLAVLAAMALYATLPSRIISASHGSLIFRVWSRRAVNILT